MRWSPIVLVLAVLTASCILSGTVAAPIEIPLEKRGFSITKAATRFIHSIRAKDFKTNNYRKTAIDQGAVVYSKGKSGRVKKMPHAQGADVKSKDADHKLEAQTVNSALKEAGIHRISDLGHKIFGKVKNVLNGVRNLALVDKSINQSKNHATRAALSGKSPKVGPYERNYIQKTSKDSLHVAKDLDKILKDGGHSVDIHGKQKDVLKKTTGDTRRAK